MTFTVIFPKLINCFVLDVELGSLENDGKRSKDWSEKKNGENGDMDQSGEMYVFIKHSLHACY